MAGEETGQVYHFGAFCLDQGRRRLLLADREIHLVPKAFDTLLYLVARRHRVVTKHEILDALWPEVSVTENVLTQCIREIRSALDDHVKEPQFIRTFSKVGYQFIAQVGETKEDHFFSAWPLISEPPQPGNRTHPLRELHEQQQAPEALASILPRQENRENILGGTAQAAGIGGSRTKTLFILAGAFLLLASFAVMQYRRPGGDNREAAVRSLAVLPFKSLEAGGHDEVLELGMADTLITRMSMSRLLEVRPTSAVRNFTDATEDAVKVGRSLQVDAVVDGNIQRMGDRIRVTVRLIDVHSGLPLWAGQFDEMARDIFAVQDSICRQVAQALALELTGQDWQKLGRHSTQDMEAYQLDLRGRFHGSKGSADGILKAIDYFQQAVQKDPGYALAYADLSAALHMLPFRGLQGPEEAFAGAKKAALRAVELDNNLAEAHAALAMVLRFHDWDWAGSEREFRKAIELQPNYALAHHRYGVLLQQMGRLEESHAEIARAYELDPVSLLIGRSLADSFFLLGQYDKAAAQYEKTLELDPSFQFARLGLAWTLEKKGKIKQAIEVLQTGRIAEDSPAILAGLGYAYAISGNRVEAEKLIDELKRTADRYISPYQFAVIYAGLGEKDEAFKWLKKAYQARSESMLLLKIDPRLATLRTDPRFADLLDRMHLRS